MRREYGNEIYFVKCRNPRKGIYSIAWDFQKMEDSDNYSYMEELFNHKPTLDEIKEIILNWYNEQIDKQILSGYKWTDSTGQTFSIWLSDENQRNYKAIYDAAKDTGGEGILPQRFKFGITNVPEYKVFETLEELQSFFYGSLMYIAETYNSGWDIKDSIDWSKYEL